MTQDKNTPQKMDVQKQADGPKPRNSQDNAAATPPPLVTALQAPLAPGGALDTLGRASLMGLHLVSGMIVGALLGYALDRWLDTFPWCSALGFLFGIVAGFRNMWIDARYLIRQSEGPSRPQSSKQKTDPPHVDH